MKPSPENSDQFFRLGPKALIAAMCRCCGSFVLFCAVGLFLYFSLGLLGVSLDLERIPLFPILLGIFVWSLALAVVGHFFRSYKLDENCLQSREGVIWYRHIAVSLNRVQHASVVRGPVERIVGLATLTVHTAGPALYAVSVNYLDLEQANEMLRKIVPNQFEQSEDASKTD